MADGINVGSVEVSVVPNAENFNERIKAAVTPAADAAGKQIADAISKGIRDGLSDPASTAPAAPQGTRAGDAFGAAFKNRVKAALAALPAAEIQLEDEAAQAKLDFLREELTSLSSQKIGVDISDTEAVARLTALRAEMDNLAARSASVQVKVDTAAASAQLDKFFAETTVKAEATGDKVGDDLTKHAASSVGRGSPLIMSAVLGGLVAGGPAVAAASVLLFGGLAAGAAATSTTVRDSFTGLGTYVINDVQRIGQEVSGEFVGMSADIKKSFDQIAPSIETAIVTVTPELHSIVDALLQSANTAIPAFTRAIQQGQPVVQGLDALIRDLGSGVAGLMDALTAHSGAEGAVLSELGQTLQILLPTLGQLLGEGAELGQSVLPVLNVALTGVSDVLHFIGPALPPIISGFLAFKTVSALTGPLGTLSAKLQTVAADGGKMAQTLAGNGAAAVSKLQGALPAVGAVLAVGAIAFELYTQQVDTWAHALLEGGNAAAQAASQMGQINTAVHENTSGFLGMVNSIFGTSNAWRIQGHASDDAKQKAQDLYKAMSPLEQKQQDVTKATNDLQLAVEKYGPNSEQAAAASGRLASAQGRLETLQNQVKAATDGASGAQQTNADRLQQIADKAGAAGTQINLLKGDLDQLTGKTISTVQAEDAVQQAIDAATTATQGQSGALVVGNDVLGTHTARAAAAREALIQIANSSNQLISTMEQQGATVSDVTTRDGQLRDSFIKSAEQMGYNSDQAHALADQIYGIPAERDTKINADTQTAAQYLSNLQSQIDNMRGKNIEITVSAQGGLATYTTDQRNLLYNGRAMGGPIVGPGSGTSDTAGLFALSNGEHVWTAAEVDAAGGHAGVESLRQAVLANGRGLAGGGPVIVNVDLDERQVDSVVSSVQHQMSANSPYTGSVAGATSQQAVQIGARMAAAAGWTGFQWTDLFQLWMRESGWNPYAVNKSSGAYGIPQSLGHGHPFNLGDSAAQIGWGINYIRGRYGSPANAWAHEVSAGWYDQGGLLPPGPSLVYNGTGSPELVAPKQTFEQVMSGATGGAAAPTQIVGAVFNGPVYQDPADTARENAQRVRRLVPALGLGR